MCVLLVATTKPYPNVHRSKREKYFQDPITGKQIEFPSITDKFSLNLSIIIPAYNEEERCNVS